MKKILMKFWFHTQRKILNPVVREKLSKAMAITRPKMLEDTGSESKDIVENLLSTGFSPITDVISEEQILDIKNYLSDKKMFERYDRKRVEFGLNDIPDGAHTGSYSEDVLSGCPHLLNIANNTKILEVVSGFLECKPTLSNITLWNSFPSEDGPRNAEYFHRDVDDIKFIKVFIYLTDVDEESGPHVYVEGSSKANKLLRIRRYQDQEVYKEFNPEKIRVITGKVGDAFIEDTFGLHKGTVVEKGIRTVLQFEYSMFPIASSRYDASFAEGVAHVDPYINRLCL